MKISRVIALFVAIFMVAGAILACGQLGLSNQSNEPAWTPPASTGAPGRSVQGGDVLPTVPATEALPLVAALPFATAEPETTLPPTADPHHVVITENDIATAVKNGAASGSGAQVEGLNVRFTGGKTVITAANVSYGFVSVQNMIVTGRLVARKGALQMDVESVEPQGIVGAVIPGLINSGLQQYASRWYVEDVQTHEGQVELRIR